MRARGLLLGLLWSLVAASTAVAQRVTQDSPLGPNGGLKVECIFGCAGGGGGDGAINDGVLATTKATVRDYTTSNPLAVSLTDANGDALAGFPVSQSGSWLIQGMAAHDAVVAGNPLLVGGYASAAAPTDVSADGDAVRAWYLRNGAAAMQATFAGVLWSIGNGTAGSGTPRVTIASDNTPFAVKTQDGSGNALTSLAAGAQRPLSVAILDAAGNQITSFGASNSYGAAFPATGTAVGFSDGTNLQGARVVDGDTGAGTVYTLISNMVFRASGGPVEAGTSSNPWNVVFAATPTVNAAQSGTWTVQPGNTANTTPWLFSIAQGGNTAAVNASSQLSVNCANCSGSGVSQQDNTGFTPGTTNMVPMGAEVDDTATTATTENNAGALRMSTRRELYGQIRDAAGNERGANVTAANALKVDGSAVTQPVSGSLTVTQGTGTNLHIVCDSGCGGASSFADNAAFTFGTTPINVSGYVLDDVAPNAATENSAAAPRMSANRVPYSILRDAAGNERGANVNASNQLSVSVDNTVTVASHAVTNAGTFAVQAAQSGTWTVQPGNTANTTPWLFTISQGGNAATVSAGGALKVDGSAVTQPVSGTVTANQGGAPWSTNETQLGGTAIDVNTGTASAGTQRVVLATNQPNLTTALNVADAPLLAALQGTGGNDTTLLAILRALTQGGTPKGAYGIKGSFGNLVGSTGNALNTVQTAPAPMADPCSGLAKQNAAISQTANARLIVGGAGKVYLCSVLLVGADAENVSLVEGTGSTCGTGTAAVIGGTTAANGPNLAANGGFQAGGGNGSIAIAATAGTDVCLFQSGAGRVAGNLTYVIR
jgi:hypothetical protein